MKRLGIAICSFIACSALSAQSFAQQVPAGPTFTAATAKGTIGGALLGAEAVMLVEAAAETKPAWAYAVGGGLGAIGGGIGGYFAEQGDPKISLYLLVGGMALALPTTVAVLSAAAYEPVNYTEDRPPADEPVADPARSGPATDSKPTSKHSTPRAPSATVARAPMLPPALFGLKDGQLSLSVPAVEVRQMYTRTEIALYGVKQHPEVEVPVVNVVF
jgi:hypothetical protein